MASLREIRNKIRSVRSTEQITKAMKMVAAARMRKAQNAILSSRPFAEKLEQALSDIHINGSTVPEHPFFRAAGAGRPCLLLVTGDKGLCGAFNSNVLRAAVAWLQRHEASGAWVATAGRKGRELVLKLQEEGIQSLVELPGIFPKVSFAHAELLGRALIEALETGRISSVTVLYNEFKSAVSQRVVERDLLPIAAAPAQASRAKGPDFRFEPPKEELLAALLPRHLKAQIYRILLESQAAELAARMSAMDSASKNAAELIDHLTLTLNRTRQSLITREIAELVSGAEALAQ
ncbi:MAG: ATP synthase F1 subunit gamma [Elusimicrobiota bacterium]|jgi:F-type H+-transporting ATPase subunit gamma